MVEHRCMVLLPPYQGLLLRGTWLTIVRVDGTLLVCGRFSRDLRNGSKRALQLVVAQALLSLAGELVHVSFPVTLRLDTHHATESPTRYDSLLSFASRAAAFR